MHIFILTYFGGVGLGGGGGGGAGFGVVTGGK